MKYVDPIDLKLKVIKDAAVALGEPWQQLAAMIEDLTKEVVARMDLQKDDIYSAINGLDPNYDPGDE